MIKIIEHGTIEKKRYEKCGCLFSYEKEDMEGLVIALFLAFVGMSCLCYYINYTWCTHCEDLNHEWAERCTKINDSWKQLYDSLLNDSEK